MTDYKQTLRPVVRPSSIIIGLLLVTAIIVGLRQNHLIENVSAAIFIFMVAAVLIVKPVFTRLIISIQEDTLSTRLIAFGVSISWKNYKLMEIREPAKISGPEKYAFWGNGLKIKESTPSILIFKYRRKNISIGNGYFFEDLDGLVVILDSYKKKL